MGAQKGFMNFCQSISLYRFRDIWEWECLSIVWESPGDGYPPNRELPRMSHDIAAFAGKISNAIQVSQNRWAI